MDLELLRSLIIATPNTVETHSEPGTVPHTGYNNPLDFLKSPRGVGAVKQGR